MSDEQKDVNAQSSGAETDVQSDSSQAQNAPAVKEEKKDDGLVPRERLNEEASKRKEAERVAAEREQQLQQLKSVLDGKSSQGQRDKAVDDFARQYNLPPEFVEGLASVLSPKLASQSKPDPIALEAHAEVRFAQELDDLESEIPDVAEMTREEKKELKKRRFSPEYIRTPLKSIYRDMMFDKVATKKTFESSRSGGRVAETEDSKQFKPGMSVDQAREWFSKNTSFGKRKR